MKHWTMERAKENEDLPYEIGESITLTLTGTETTYECIVTETEDGNLSALWCPSSNQSVRLKVPYLN